MTLTQVLLTSNSASIYDGYDFPASTGWDGTVLTAPQQFLDGIFQGYFLDWAGVDEQSSLFLFVNTPYSGYTTNFAATENSISNIANFTNLPYSGYTTNFAGISLINDRSEEDVDFDSVIDHPKDQHIYYKLKGYNTVSYTHLR